MDVNKLEGIIPDKIIDALTVDFLLKAGIDGPRRLSNFLGQSEEESGNFTREKENLNYSVKGLLATFPSHFEDEADAAKYERNPEMIANRVYANRLGNGDEAGGEGWKYRGRGDLQITGKDNYQSFTDWVNDGTDFVTDPDAIEQPPYDLLCAAWFFSKNKLWQICDKGVDMATVTILTHHINGGDNGLQTRYNYTQKIYNALTT